MIKKVIGIVVALAVIVVIVLAAMHGEKFKSLVFDEGEPASAVEASVEGDVVEPGAGNFPDPQEADSAASAQPDTVRVHRSGLQ